MNKMLKRDWIWIERRSQQNMYRLVSRTPIGIRFGDYVFSAPVPQGRFTLPPRSAGVYVVLMPDPSWGPWHLQPLFFGEFGAQQETQMTAAQQMSCLKVAAGRTLFFATYAVPQSHGWAISQIKNELIRCYRPISNLEPIDTAAELANRLYSLEKKMIEHDTALVLALAAIGQMVQPQPEPRKRIVGFRPDPAGSRSTRAEKSKSSS